MTVLGIDIGGKSIKAGIVEKNGKIVDNHSVPTEPEKGRAAVVKNIVSITEYFLKKHTKIKHIGFGIPGIVDKKGYVKYCPNIPFSSYDLGTTLKKKLKKKLFFGNDADNFTLAVFKYGPGKGTKNMIGLTLGTGIGSGLIIDAKPYSYKGAPEMGHTTIKYDSFGPLCCDNAGCLESLIGRKSFPFGNPLETYKKALIKDPGAILKFESFGKFLGISISNFINIFNPDVIVLGGELSNAEVFFRKSMEKEIKRRAFFKNKKIVVNKLRYAGTVGAALLAMDSKK